MIVQKWHQGISLQRIKIPKSLDQFERMRLESSEQWLRFMDKGMRPKLVLTVAKEIDFQVKFQ